MVMSYPVVSASRWKENILAFTTKTEPLTVVGGGGNVRLSSHGSRLGRCSTVALVLKTAYDTRGELCSRSVVLAEAKNSTSGMWKGLFELLEDASATQLSVSRVYSATSLIIPKLP